MPPGTFNDCTQKIAGHTTGETTLVISTAAYVIGDAVGGLIEFDVHSAGGGGRITDFYLVDEDNQSEPYTLYFFDKKPTVVADADPWEANMTAADIGKKIKTQALATYETINSIDQAHIEGIDQDFEASEGKLYLYMIPSATPDYTDTDKLKAWVTVLLN
jgi:hypothetical protein